MTRIHSILLKSAKFVAAAALALLLVSPLHVADANGSWSWTTPGRNGGPDRKITLKLKVEGEKVTGKVSMPGREGAVIETDIEEGKIKGDDISFKVVREFNGNRRATSYTGKIAGDAIKGKSEFENRDGEKMSRDWEAKRDAEKK